jgi:hypothetical protein
MFTLPNILYTLLTMSQLTSPAVGATLPTKVLAGVTVVDTPLVQAAQKYARAHADDMTYNHVMRSWLFGTIMAQRIPSKFGTVDPEAYAVAAIFHDLGWDHTGELVSKDKRFEVDGGIAARAWLLDQQKDSAAKNWDEHKIQLVWDAIALHATPSIAQYKEPLVALLTTGIAADFQGPKSDFTGVLTWDDYNAAKAEFPRHSLAEGVRSKICFLAQTKPETTYGEFR